MRHRADAAKLDRGLTALLVFACCLGLAAPGHASFEAVTAADVTEDGDSVDAREPEHVRVVASELYRAGWIQRSILGSGYRDLWEQEIELPMLDLAAEGGGLVPTARFGGLQTAVLGFVGADGRSYTFRGTDKDPSAVLHEMLQDTLVDAIVQDQMAAQHPGAPLAAGVVTEAAGVLAVRERMVVMPDDPALGRFREEFAGMVGSFFEFPTPASDGREGFHGALEIIDHEELYDRLARDNRLRVDVEAFLRARLVDIFLGDFDRHRKQWRWARLPDEPRWQPIPEDRDMAFARYDGLGPRLLKIYIPILQRYDEGYPWIEGLTLHGWEQDRWLLPHLSWSDWEPIVADLKSRLNDEVIDRAIAALPPEYVEVDGDRLRRAMRGRRDRLAQAARSYYEHLAREVDIQTSDASDRVRVERDDDYRLVVEIRERDDRDGAGRLVFRRAFVPGETREIRLYLRGGDDRVEILDRSRRIRLRVIAGEGAKRVDDRAAGGTRIYDELGSVEVLPGHGTRVDRRPYEPPSSEAGFVDVNDVPPRDWGSRTIPIPELGFEPDVGLYLGAAALHTRYGFRKHPWSSRHHLGFGWSFEANAPRIRYGGRFRPENSSAIAQLDFGYSGIEVLRFYGFGNETDDDGSDKRFRVRNKWLHLQPSVSLPVWSERLRASGGAELQFSRTASDQRLIDELDPYGNNDFGLVGAFARLRLDTRRSITEEDHDLQIKFHDNPAAGYPTSGFLIDVAGHVRPPVWDVEKPYGFIEASIAGYLSLGEDARTTLGLRIGGKETFGRTPYFDGATVGGGMVFSGNATNRGFRSRRFLGDSSVYANADLRVHLARLEIIVPTDIGVHGFADAGRVFFRDESSDDWHPSGGAGIWIAPLVRTNTISVSVAHGGEDTLAYFRAGFHY